MLSCLRISFVAFLLLIAFCTSNVCSARADTYEVFTLVVQNAVSPFGLDDNGTAVLFNSECEFSVEQTSCYQTYVFGKFVEATATPPDLNYDNGEPCTVPNADTEHTNPVCNNGRELFETDLQTPFGESMGIVGGPASDLITISTHGDLFRPEINSLGDMLFLNTVGDQVIEYVDVTSRLTPEPSSFVLMSTGLLGIIEAVRRKPRSKR